MGVGTMLKLGVLGVPRAIFSSFLSKQRHRTNVKFRPKLGVLCPPRPPGSNAYGVQDHFLGQCQALFDQILSWDNCLLRVHSLGKRHKNIGSYTKFILLLVGYFRFSKNDPQNKKRFFENLSKFPIF